MGRSSELAAIDRLFRWGAGVGDDDARLLERFRDGRDESAFAALVDRHGPMVLGVCRRTLRDDRDVEDAFQATFLILARRAGTIRGVGRVGPWLHGVAHRVATRARADAARRYVREGVRLEVEPSGPACREPERDELRAVIDDELGRLPGRFRDPVVLCHLEGLTHDQAADRLRLPVGTVRSRLARARTKLRDRLERRGLSAADAPALLPFAEPLPPALLEATLRSCLASSTAPASTLAAAGAVALADGVLRTMIVSQSKLAVAALGTMLTLGGASGYALQQPGQGGQEAVADLNPNPPASESAGGTNQPATTEEQSASPAQPAPAIAASDKQQASNMRLYLEQLERNLRSKKYQQEFLNQEIKSMEADREVIRRRLKDLEAKLGVGAPGSSHVRAGEAAPTAGGDGPEVAVKRVTGRGTMSGAVGMGGPGAIVPDQGDGPRKRGSYVSGPSLVVAQSSNGRVLTGYSMRLKEAKSLRIAPDGDDDLKVTPVLGSDLAAIQVEGAKVDRIATFSASDGQWHPQDLREPTHRAVPVIEKNLAAYQIGKWVYAFSGVANRWDVLELPEDEHEPPAAEMGGMMSMMPGMMGMRAMSMGGMGTMRPFNAFTPVFRPGWLTCQSDHQLHLFSAETGRWTSIEIEEPKAVEEPEPTP